MIEYSAAVDERDMGEVVSEGTVKCRYCGKLYIELAACLRHQERCSENDDVDGGEFVAEELDVDADVDAEPPFYTVAQIQERSVYHVTMDCYHCNDDMIERDRMYVEYHDLPPCNHCTNE